MTTYELTWNESRNNAYVPTSLSDLGVYFNWFVKAALMGQLTYRDYTNTVVGSPAGAWAVQGSSDGVTGAMDAVDRWGSTYVPSKQVRSSGQGTAHSWIVLKSPWGLYMLIDCCNYYSAGYTHIWHVEYSLTAYTGGSATNSPTTSNAFMPNGASSYVQCVPYNVAPNCHFNAWLATNGEFMLMASQDGSGAAFTTMMMRQLVELHTGDNHNAHTYFEYENPGTWALTNFFSQVGSGNAQGWQTRSATPATAAVGGSGTYLRNGSNVVSNDMQEYDPFDGLSTDMAIYIYAWTTGHKSIRGRLRDVSMAPALIADDRAEPALGPCNSIKVGGQSNALFLPWHDPNKGMYL